MPDCRYWIWDIDNIATRLREFSDERNWERYHTPRNLAIALSVEVGELLELFLWDRPLDNGEHYRRLADEAADVAIYLIRLSDVSGIDLARAIAAKIERNEKRFPPGSGEFG